MKQLRSTSLLVLVLLVAAACARPTPTPTAAPVQIESTPAATATATATQAPPALPPAPTNTATSAPAPLPAAMPTSLPPAAQPTPCGPPAGWPAYTIQAGDTLFSIASNTGATVDQLKLANCLAGDAIYAGQTLFVPFIPYIPPNIPAPAASQSYPAQGSMVTVEPPLVPQPGDPTVTVTPESAAPGKPFTIKIEHFKPKESITVVITFAPTLGVVYQENLAVNTSGELTIIYASSTEASPGRYTVNVTGTDNARTGQFEITNAP